MEFPTAPTLFDISLRICCRTLLKPEPNPASKQEIKEAHEHECLLKLLRTGAFSSVSEKILEHLVKFYGPSLSNGCLQAVCPPHLKELSLKGCLSLSWAGVKLALSSLRCLRSLDLSQCDQLISDDPDIGDLHLATTLTSLNLEECQSLTDTVVQNLLRAVPSLQHLNVSGCDGLTDRVFLLDEELQLFREAHGKTKQKYECQLTSVDLSGCHGITSTAVRHLVTLTGPTLKSVNLARCKKVDCVALLYLCGYGLLSAIPIILSGRDGQTDVKNTQVLQQSLRERYEMQAKIKQKETLSKQKEHMSKQKENMSKQKENVNKTSETGISDIDIVVLENEAEICNALKSYSSDVICIKENESQNFDDLVFANNYAEKKYMKSRSLDSFLQDETKHFAQKAASDTKITSKGFGTSQTGALENCLTEVKNRTTEFCSISSEDFSSNRKTPELQNSYNDSDFKLGFLETTEEELNCQSKGNVESTDNENVEEKEAGICCAIEGCTSDVIHFEENKSMQSDGFVTTKTIDESISFSNPNHKTGELGHSSASTMSTLQVEKETVYNKSASTTAELFELVNEANLMKNDFSVKCDRSTREENVLLDLPMPCCVSARGQKEAVMEMNQPAIVDSDQFCEVKDMAYQKPSVIDGSEKSAETNKFYLGSNVYAISGDLATTRSSGSDLLQKGKNTDDNEPKDVEVCLSRNPHHVSACALKNDVETEIENDSFPCQQMYSSDLVSLDVRYINFTDSDPNMLKTCLETFFKHNKNLVKLKISWKDLTNEMTSFIANQAEHLEEVSLVNCDQVTNSGVADLGKRCKKITNMDLKGVCFITDSALLPCLVNTTLRHLCLSECGIADVTLHRLAENVSETLQSLDLAWCDEITETGLAAMLFQTFFCLRSLSLRQGPVSNQTLVLLSECCPALTRLILNSVQFDLEDEPMVHLAKKLIHLKSVDIGWNAGLTDSTIDAFLTFCPKLESAIFAGIKRISSECFLKLIADDGSWVRRQSMLRNLQRERRLQKQWGMNLQAVEELTEVYLPHRSTVFAPSLTHLDLTYCDLVNDFHLAEISAVCRGSLEIIDYHSDSVTSSWIRFSPVAIT